MDDQNQYTAIIRRLNTYGYIVIARDTRYIVQNINLLDDRSTMPTLAHLIDFMELMEWAAQRAAPTPPMITKRSHNAQE